MALEFQQLGGVELLSTMPDDSTIFAETEGKVKRVPSNYVDSKFESYINSNLANADLLEEAPEGASVLIESNGEFKRVSGNAIGGGAEGMIVNFTMSMDDGSITADKTYQEVYDAILAGTTVYGLLSASNETYTSTIIFNATVYEIKTPELTEGVIIFCQIGEGSSILRLFLLSNNTVQNSNIQIPQITTTSSVTSGSSSLITSGGVYTALEAKQDKIIDSVILSSSTADSTKKFKITVDDSGTLTATEVTT